MFPGGAESQRSNGLPYWFSQKILPVELVDGDLNHLSCKVKTMSQT